MSFKDDLATDLDNTFFNKIEFAEDESTVTYTPVSGSPYEIAAIFDRKFEAVDPELEQSSVISTDPVAMVIEANLALPVAKGDKITVKGQLYDIVQKEPDGVGIMYLRLNKVKV